MSDCTTCAEYDGDKGYCPKYCEVIRKTLDERTRWIPVSERLPSIPVWYLVTAKSKRNGNNFVRILHYNGEKYGWEEQSTCAVLAWADLPEPWRGEDDG